MVQDEYTLLQIILRSLENQLKCPLEKELKKKKVSCFPLVRNRKPNDVG